MQKAADNLNLAIFPRTVYKKSLLDFIGKNINILEKAMSKDDVARLRQFVEDNAQIKNILSISFDNQEKWNLF